MVADEDMVVAPEVSTSTSTAGEGERALDEGETASLAAVPLHEQEEAKDQERRKKEFPWKLHVMLDDASKEDKGHIVSWNHDGKSFKVHNPMAFMSEVAPRYFNHKHYRSFQKMLNLYDFQKVMGGSDRGGYTHHLFQKDRRELCHNLRIRTTRSMLPTRKARSPRTSPTSLEAHSLRQDERRGGLGLTEENQRLSSIDDISMGYFQRQQMRVGTQQYSGEEELKEKSGDNSTTSTSRFEDAEGTGRADGDGRFFRYQGDDFPPQSRAPSTSGARVVVPMPDVSQEFTSSSISSAGEARLPSFGTTRDFVAPPQMTSDHLAISETQQSSQEESGAAMMTMMMQRTGSHPVSLGTIGFFPTTGIPMAPQQPPPTAAAQEERINPSSFERFLQFQSLSMPPVLNATHHYPSSGAHVGSLLPSAFLPSPNISTDPTSMITTRGAANSYPLYSVEYPHPGEDSAQPPLQRQQNPGHNFATAGGGGGSKDIITDDNDDHSEKTGRRKGSSPLLHSAESKQQQVVRRSSSSGVRRRFPTGPAGGGHDGDHPHPLVAAVPPATIFNEPLSEDLEPDPLPPRRK